MTIKHLLVHVDSSPRAAERIDLAVRLAQRFGARLTGLFAESDTLGASLVGRRTPNLMARAAAEARTAFGDRVGAAGVESEWWPLPPCDHASVSGRAEVCCRYADLAIFGQHQAAEARAPEDLVEQALFHAGRPVLVVPSVGHYPDVGRRVLVGWNGSRESTRALHDALPFLEQAEEIHVLSFQRPAEEPGPGEYPPLDVTAHLQAHGLKPLYERFYVDSDEIDAGDMLLNRSFDLQADLTVLGGYAVRGLPRARPGGSTRKMLESMTTPVLFSH